MVYNWSQAVRAEIAVLGGPALPDSPYWDYFKESTPADVWRRLWTEPASLEAMFRIGTPYRDNLEAVRSLQEHPETDIIVVTRRPRGAAVHTLRWLARVEIAAVEVYVIPEDVPKSSVRCDWYIDDSPAVVEELARAGRRVYLQDRPWNRECPFGQRVLSLQEAADLEKHLR